MPAVSLQYFGEAFRFSGGRNFIDLDISSFLVLSYLLFLFLFLSLSPTFTRVIGFIRASEGDLILREEKEMLGLLSLEGNGSARL